LNDIFKLRTKMRCFLEKVVIHVVTFWTLYSTVLKTIIQQPCNVTVLTFKYERITNR